MFVPSIGFMNVPISLYDFIRTSSRRRVTHAIIADISKCINFSKYLHTCNLSFNDNVHRYVVG